VNIDKVRRVAITISLSNCLLLAMGIAHAQDAVVRITAHISLEKNVITQHEPVMLKIAFEDPSERGVVVNFGYDDEKIDIILLDPQGTEFRKPRAAKSGWDSPNIVSVVPRVTSSGLVSLNSWFDFGKTGSYRIEVTLSPNSSAKEPFLYSIANNAASLDLTVLPRDERSLESACADLLARIQDLRSAAASITAAKALSKVNDAAAVPFLVAALQGREFKGLMIDALARLRTKEAVDALVTASESKDPETRSLAHSALVSIGMAQSGK
jgi:hypothetical protein